MFETATQATDQAAGLRRLFAPRARLLPVFASSGSGETLWLARLGEAFAAAGSRTVLVDAARMQLAAALGLHARFELQHALEGQCAASRVLLDAAGLGVVPAARACEAAARQGIGLSRTLAPILERPPPADLVLLLIPPQLWRWLPAGDVLVPVQASRESVAAAVASIAAAGGQGNLAFRLLFLGMDERAAATLARRLAASIGMRSNASLREGAVAPSARSLSRVAAAAGEWQLGELHATEMM